MSEGLEFFLIFLIMLIFVGIYALIIVDIFRGYARPIKQDYIIKAMRFETLNILIGEYRHGFDEKYKRGRRIYLILTKDTVIIAPFYSRNKSNISYDKITKFDIVLKEPKKDYIVELDENRFPRNIRDLEYIQINYITDNGIEDIVVLEFDNYVRYYKFNKYVYSKCKVFNIVKSQINEKFIQSYYTSARTFKSNTY